MSISCLERQLRLATPPRKTAARNGSSAAMGVLSQLLNRRTAPAVAKPARAPSGLIPAILGPALLRVDLPVVRCSCQVRIRAAGHDGSSSGRGSILSRRVVLPLDRGRGMRRTSLRDSRRALDVRPSAPSCCRVGHRSDRSRRGELCYRPLSSPPGCQVRRG